MSSRRPPNGHILFSKTSIKSGYKRIFSLARPPPSYAGQHEYSHGNNRAFGKTYSNTSKSQSIFLLSSSCNYNIFDFIPRTFTITTNTGSGKFNTHFLGDTSSIIADFLVENPENLEYHLDIDDKDNVLGKFEQIYQGDFVIFDEDELPISQKITKLLNIIECPNFMKPESLKRPEGGWGGPYNQRLNEFGVEINYLDLSIYLQRTAPRSFIIVTNKKEYECNIFGVYSSGIIREHLAKNPSSNKYVYNFDDDFDEFQAICDIFNFKNVILTRNNIDSIKEIAEDLQITVILNDIENYIKYTEKVSKTIDEQQALIDSIDTLFDLLYNIKEKTVETVKFSILESKWPKTEDNVKELAAFIIQVAKTDFLYHPYIVDLLLQLDQEANEDNQLKILIPTITKQLMITAFEQPHTTGTTGIQQQQPYGHPTPNSTPVISKNNNYNCSMATYGFIYHLYKKEIISEDDLKKELRNLRKKNDNLKCWFFPEIDEINQSKSSACVRGIGYSSNSFSGSSIAANAKAFIKSYQSDKIDMYKKMRDSGEPDDELTKAIRRDDVDMVQQIISSSGETDTSKKFIPFNIFENYVPNGSTRYINYAAAYGSLRCFKYFLLNHEKIDKTTFSLAVYGGNIEIIKIVDLNEQDDEEYKPRKVWAGNQSNQLLSTTNDKIIPAIMKHRNDLFDWIFEQKFTVKEPNEDLLALVEQSVINGNAHSLVEIIDKGFNLENYKDSIKSIIQDATQNGFYTLTQLFFNLIGNNLLQPFYFNTIMIIFDNISIFALLADKMNQEQFEMALSFAINNGLTNIVKYFIEKLDKNMFEITPQYLFSILKQLAQQKKKKNDLFIYLLDHTNLENINDFTDLNILLMSTCSSANLEIAKKIIDLIIAKKESLQIDSLDFTDGFVNAVSSGSNKICKYFFERKVPINYEKLSSRVSELGSLDADLLSQIFDNVSPESKERIIGCFDQAIQKKNKNAVKFLLKENPSIDHALLLAVDTKDLELVEIILEYNSQPSYINKLCPRGTALTIAVSNNDLPVVNKLLSLPGIDPSIYSSQNMTPLLIAVEKDNIEIINAIIDFYGDDIQSQKVQINEALKIIFDHSNVHEESPNSTYGSGPTYEYGSYMKRKEDLKKLNGKRKIILKRLMETKCINPNFQMTNNTLLTYACTNNSIELVQNLLQYDDIDVNLYEPLNGDSPLIIAVKNNNLDIIKLLIEHPKINVNQKNYIEETALVIAAKNNSEDIVNLIINNDKFNPGDSNVNYAFYVANAEIAKSLSTLKSLDVNFTWFPIPQNLLRQSNSYTSKVGSLGKPWGQEKNNQNGAQWEQTNNNNYYYNQNGQWGQANNNNNNNQNRNWGQSYGNHISLQRVVDKNGIVRYITSYSNYSIMNNTTLLSAVNNDDINKIDIIIQHPSFDKVKSQFNTAFSISLQKNSVLIFRKLIKLIDDDINIVDLDGKSLLYYSVMNGSKEIIIEILTNPKFDSKKSDILTAFVQSYTRFIKYNPREIDDHQNPSVNDDDDIEENKNEENGNEVNPFKVDNADHYNVNNDEDILQSPILIMEELYDFDKEHDRLIDFTKLLPTGFSFFTSCIQLTPFDEEIFKFLLKRGADPNEPDRFGVYPLQKAINLGSTKMVKALINSEKIDFSKQIPIQEITKLSTPPESNNHDHSIKKILGSKYTTYLHLAASQPNESILQLFLDKKKIDVNITNDLGETPLMVAARFGIPNNIELLFNCDDLNFLYLNNEGNDALQILDIESTIKNKDEYQNWLLMAIENNDQEKNQFARQTTWKSSAYGANKANSFATNASPYAFNMPNNDSNSTTKQTIGSSNKANPFAANASTYSAANKSNTFAANASPYGFKKPNNDSNSTTTPTIGSSNKSNPFAANTSPYALNMQNNDSNSTTTQTIGSSNKANPFAANTSTYNAANKTSALAANTSPYAPKKPNNESNSTTTQTISSSNKSNPFAANASTYSAANKSNPFAANASTYSAANKSNPFAANASTYSAANKSNPFAANASTYSAANKTSALATNTSPYAFKKPNNESNSNTASTYDATNKTGTFASKTSAFSFSKGSNEPTSTAVFAFGVKNAMEKPDSLSTVTPGSGSVSKSTNEDESNKSSLFLTKAPSISSDNQVQKQPQISSSVQPRKLEFYHESFSEEPDQNFLKKVKPSEPTQESRKHGKSPRIHKKIETVVSDILNDEDPQKVHQLSRSISRIASRKARKLAEFLADDERNEEYELQNDPYMYAPQYSPFSQNAMMMQQQTQLMQMIQQQTQLMQMIQMNNANQAQFNLQMAHQNQLLQQMKKKKRRDQT